MKQKSIGATLLLVGVGVQVTGAAFPAALQIASVMFFVLSGVAAGIMKSPVAVLAAVGGTVIAAVTGTSEQEMLWWMVIIVNLLYLALYLPLQVLFGDALYEKRASQQTLALGRRWAVSLVLARVFAMMGVMPFFAGQDVISNEQGQMTLLFAFQLGIEVIALITAVVSYYFMVRYLWRARNLLKA